MKKRPKIIAFYLPQYHRIPENDLWWGEGFTDWDSARSAKPLFQGHYQPRLPYRNYYYNLLDKNAVQWQVRIARKAGIYGFCIYHYWFGDRQLLEKPAENLLKWKDIDFHYCFSWANESWIASWSRLIGNSWKSNGGNYQKGQPADGCLALQKYGGKEEWKAHFEYLLPFFQDDRYIRKDGMPVFIIYKPQDLRCAAQMMPYWNALAVQNGLKGIYFIGTHNSQICQRQMNATLLYEPVYTIFHPGKWYGLIQNGLKKLSIAARRTGLKLPAIVFYSLLWNTILHRKEGRNVYYGGFADFDTSPRKGENGYVCVRATPEKFKKYFFVI